MLRRRLFVMIYSLGRVEGEVNVEVDTRKFFTFIDVRILSSSSSPASAQWRRKDRFIPKRRELKKPSEIFKGRERGDRRSRKNDGVDKEQKRAAKNKERRLEPGMDRFGFGFEAGPTRREMGSIISLQSGGEDCQEEACRRTSLSTAVTIPDNWRFPDKGGMKTLDGILRESTKKE